MPDPSRSYNELRDRVLRAMADASLADDGAFNELALEIHAFQRRFNAPYAAFCGRALPKHWRAIPAVSTEAFKLARFPLATFPPEVALACFKTSGTTGAERGCHLFRTLELYESSIRLGWDALGLPPLRAVALSLPPPQAPDSSLVHMFATLGCDFISGNSIATLRDLAEPVLLAGTALAFVALFAHGDFPLPFGSIAMETGGYKGSGLVLTKPELYARFKRHLDLAPDAILNEYSMTELSSQFYSRGLGRPHSGPPWTRILVLDPSTGHEVEENEAGVIVVHDLANLGSVSAVATRDLAIRRGDTTFELLGRDPAASPRGCSLSARDFFPS